VTAGRGWIAAALAAAVLLAVSAAKWDGFGYRSYPGAVIFQCGALALLLAWAWPRRLPVGTWRALRPAAYLFCAYAAFSMASSAWAPEPRLAAIGSLPMFFGVTWTLALGHLLTDQRHTRLILRGMFAAGTVAALAGLLYVLLSGQGSWTVQIHGLGEFFRALWQRGYLLESVEGHRNFLATFLLPPLVMGLADLLTPLLTRPAQRGATLGLSAVVLWPCLLLMLGVFALCQSWGALLGLIVGLACVFAARLSPRARWGLLAGFLLLIVSAFICLSLPAVNARLMQSHQATRWFMWQGALRMIHDHPIFGWGSGMFVLRFADYKPTGAMEFGWLGNITIYPHDELLLVAAEGGLIALGLYLAGHFFAVRGHLRKAQAQDASLRIAAWAVFGGFLAMFTHGLVEVSLRFWAPAAAYWTLLGVMIASDRSGGPAPADTRRGSRVDATLLFVSASVMVVAAAVGIVFSGAWAEWLIGGASNMPGMEAKAQLKALIRNDAEAARFSRYVPDYLVALRSRAEFELRDGNEDGSIAEYEEIERVAPGYGPVRRILATLYLDRARKAASLSRRAATADLQKAVERIKLAIRQNPYDADSRLVYADLLLQPPDRNVPAAIGELRAAVKGDPKRMEPRYWLATLLARSGQKEEARAVLDEAAALCPPGDTMVAPIKNLQGQLAKP
jgi:tetratricopeptide (TPR) repeat protein